MEMSQKGKTQCQKWDFHGFEPWDLIPRNLDLTMTHMQVSWNRGTPKSSILIGLSIINHPFGDPPFLEPPISIHLIVQKKIQNHLLALEPWSSCSSHKQYTRWCPRFVNWFITPSKCRSTIDAIVRQLSYWVHQLKHQCTINPIFLAICLLGSILIFGWNHTL